MIADIKQHKPTSEWRTRIGFALALIAISAVWLVFPIEAWLVSLTETVAANPVSGPIFFGVLYIVSSLMLVPSTILTVAAGSIWGLWWGAVWLHIVSIVADTLMFVIAKRGLSRVRPDRHNTVLRRLDAAFEKDGFLLTVLIRWFPIFPTNVMNYLLGTTSLSLRDYFWATTLGTIPNTFVFVYLGALATQQSRDSISSDPLVVATGFTLAAVSMVGLMFYAKRTISVRYDLSNTHSPDSIRWSVYNDVADVPERVWVEQQNLFLRKPFLESIQTVDTSVSWRFAVLFERGDLTAFVPFHRFEVNPVTHVKRLSPTHATSDADRMTRWIARTFLQRFNRRVVAVGNAFSSGVPMWWISEDADNPDVVATIFARLEQEASEFDATTLMIKDCPLDLDPALMSTHGFRSYDIDPVMELRIPQQWHTFDDYLTALRSRYRTSFLKARATATEVVRRDLSVSELTARESEISELYNAVTEKAGFCPMKFQQEAFADLKRALGDSYQVVGYFADEELIGFNTRFVAGSVLYSHFFGVDPSTVEQFDLYRNIMLDDIEAAIDQECECVHFGRCAHGMKSAFGANPSGDVSWFQHRNPLIRKVFDFALRFVEPPSWPQRHPFKETDNG